VPQAHSYWQHQYLHTAGLPVTSGTVDFLNLWHNYGNAAGCAYNMVDLSHGEPGSTRCQRLPGGRYARNYTDTQSAANAFADQLTLSDYPDLRQALASGTPATYGDQAGISLNLQKWGSVRFQQWYESSHQMQGGGTSSSPPPTSKNVGGAWHRLMKTLALDGHETIMELRRATAALNRIERRLRRA